jgi:predicted PurR-regulated permease PerM
MGLGDLLGLLLAVPVASCLKTFLDAWAQQRGLGQASPRRSGLSPSEE